MLKEEASYRLASAFIKEYKKFGSYLFTLKSVDKSKWWVHFDRAAGYRYLDGWNPESHIKSCFEKYGKILPYRIYGKTALEAWKEYHHRYEEKKNNNYIIQMLDTFKKIKKWGGKYDPDYFNNNLLTLKRGNLSVYFLSLSKEFRRINNINNYIDKDLLDTKRSIVFTNKKLFNKMKELFKDDFYRGDE